MSTYEERIAYFKQLLNASRGIVFFGGAGVSTESGMPDFRSQDGLYHQVDEKYCNYQPEYLLDRDCLYNHPALFYDFLRDKMDTRAYKPNRAHMALAQMENKFGDNFLGIITQNIDGFHQQAGNTRVAEIHGTMSRCHCDCQEYPGDYVFTHPGIPKCPSCRKLIRPAVTLYGENLPMDEFSKGQEWLEHADLLIVGGTSLQVEPAASMARQHRFGKNIVIINRDATPLDEYADVLFRENIGQVLSDAMDM